MSDQAGVGARADTSAEQVARAVRAFRDAYGCDPQHVSFAPGRANLIGDHTDYCEGFVMPAALTIGCACAIGWAPADGPEFEAVAVDLDERASIRIGVTEAALMESPGWMRYVAGSYEVVRREHASDTGPVRLTVASSVPVGSGLSSSAAIEVSIATAFAALAGVDLGVVEKAKLCQKAEHEFAHVPCGLMDQLASCAGVENGAVRIDCRDATYETAALPDPEKAAFVLFDSAVSHSNASGAYAERRAACESAAEKMGVKALRDIGVGQLGSLPASLTEDEQKATRHVVTENARVLDFADAMAAGDLKRSGELLDGSHESLSNVYAVSCEELDVLADILRAQDGVYGARMTGGGFGGWVVALVDADVADTLLEPVKKAYQEKTGKQTSCRKLVAGAGARLVELGDA